MSLGLCCCRRKSLPKLDHSVERSAFRIWWTKRFRKQPKRSLSSCPAEGDADYLAEKYEKTCRRMCCILSRVMCCFSGDGGNDEVLERVGRLMAHFSHELDVTTDDMLLDQIITNATA